MAKPVDVVWRVFGDRKDINMNEPLRKKMNPKSRVKRFFLIGLCCFALLSLYLTAMFPHSLLQWTSLAVALCSQAITATPIQDALPDSAPGSFANLNRQAHNKATDSDALFKGAEALHQKQSAPHADAAAASSFRFLNSATSPYQVKSLPLVNYDIGEMYAGSLPTASSSSRNLFWIFQPSINAPVNEITIWLNGGPGCSSLEGFFEENGRFVWYPGASGPVINNYAWVNLTNVLWVEQPVSTGFSQGTVTAKSEADIAADFIGFFKNFSKLFGTANFKIYVTGESYAGRYVPYIASAMLNTGDKSTYNVSGALIYDGCIGQFDVIQEDMVVYPFAKAQNKYLGLTTNQLNNLKNAHSSCGYDTYINKYLQYPPPGVQPPRGPSSSQCQLFNKAYNYASQQNSCFNVYEVNQTCPTPNDPLAGNTPYFQRSDVKAALHAPSSVTWVECSSDAVFIGGGGSGGPEQEGDLSPDPIQGVLPQVIAATNRVLVSNGDLDMIIITNGSLLAIQNMTWNGQLGFQSAPSTPIVVSGAPGNQGVQHYERGLMWAQSFYAGHMAPEFQPAVAYRHLQWLLGYTNTL